MKGLREYKIYHCLRKTRWTKHFLWRNVVSFLCLMWLWLDKNWRWHWLQNSLNYPQITINTSIKSKHHVFKTLKVQGISDQTNLNNKLIQNSFVYSSCSSKSSIKRANLERFTRIVRSYKYFIKKKTSYYVSPLSYFTERASEVCSQIRVYSRSNRGKISVRLPVKEQKLTQNTPRLFFQYSVLLCSGFTTKQTDTCETIVIIY